LYDRTVFESVGGFDERFFCYLEDIDLGFRLRLRGERCVQVRHAEVLHIGSAISGRMSTFVYFHSYRNRIWLFAKNTPWPLLAPVIGLQGLSIVLSLAKPRTNRRAALAGVWAGLGGLHCALRSRIVTQRSRQRSSWDIAKMLVWNPLKSRPEGRLQFLRQLS
jgi:GT2 family glycosyltransferase